jgi:hypothetical protein
MRCKSFSFFVAVICLLAPSHADDASRVPPPVPVEQLLNGPDRQDIPWKVQVVQDITLQQRHLVQVVAAIRGRDYFNGVSIRDLHVITKVADAHGNWLDGQSDDHFKQPRDLSVRDTVHSFANFYLKPGDYTIAEIAYDSLHNAVNIWRMKLTVSAIAAPLPNLSRDLPILEFLPRSQAALDLKSADWDLNSPPALRSLMLDPLFLGHGHAHLPVENKKPLLIDVIVNLSDNIIDVGRNFLAPSIPPRCFPYPLDLDCFPPWPQKENSAAYKYNEGLALQVGNLVSQLTPETGCVRFSAMDVLRQDLIADRVDASKVDWDSISQKISFIDLNSIDVKALREKETELRFRSFVDAVNADDYACGLSGQKPEHVLIVVGMNMSFSPNTEVAPIRASEPKPRCYYLRMRFRCSSELGRTEPHFEATASQALAVYRRTTTA